MTYHRRRQVLCAAASVLAGAADLWCTGRGIASAAVALSLAVPVLAAAAVQAGRRDRLVLDAHRRARRAALGEAPRFTPARPCCSFWRAAEGADHTPDCARARRSGAGAGTASAWRELYEACCLRGWESRGAVHETGTCLRRAAA
ncbi:hypothetical protein ABZ920_28395 [Streptomyces sp. NPDC046831]|uniref:hypothetical protein n=1 Tax=Streptomyces sp. NPDC046831 TaxID=3154805 RepID=UPI0033E5FFCF